jgi:hypothetical protein
MGDHGVRKFFQRKPFWAITFIMIVAYFVLYSSNRVTCKADPALMVKETMRQYKYEETGRDSKFESCCKIIDYHPKLWKDGTRYEVIVIENFSGLTEEYRKEYEPYPYSGTFDKCGEGISFAYNGG